MEDIERRGGVDEVWCLGDIVGYGPDAHECLAMVRKAQAVAVAGNHDLAAVDRASLASFSPDAAAAIRWTSAQLKAEERSYLAGLPLTLTRDSFTLAHGSPREPVWEYVVSTGNARENFASFSTPFCLVGHSHLPLLFKQEGSEARALALRETSGRPLMDGRFIINPGSAGQPRDGDPRASYAIYDSELGLLRLHRVPYDIESVQARFAAAGLPPRLAARLGGGS
jgi:diadenosine tetraphosphatase ApaH/serine/threonine PP2A family protein phosphatase